MENPGMMQYMGSQRVRYDLETAQQQWDAKGYISISSLTQQFVWHFTFFTSSDEISIYTHIH